MSFHLLISSSLISFNIPWFPMFKSCVPFIKFIPKYFILLKPSPYPRTAEQWTGQAGAQTVSWCQCRTYPASTSQGRREPGFTDLSYRGSMAQVWSPHPLHTVPQSWTLSIHNLLTSTSSFPLKMEQQGGADPMEIAWLTNSIVLGCGCEASPRRSPVR